jgi:predicted DCC family thiol-disulfide oxidoreductase YuxK
MSGSAAAERQPGRPLLVFDGDCGFCTSSARFGQRRLKLEHVEPWQFLDLDALGLTEAACQEAVQWVAVDGSIASAERAVIAALRHAGGAWKTLGAVLDIPGVRHVGGMLYRLIATYRHRLPGGTAACRLRPGRIVRE